MIFNFLSTNTNRQFKEMHFSWYLNRLKKMSAAEIFKRLEEFIFILYSRARYRDKSKWPYRRFASEELSFQSHSLPGCRISRDWNQFRVYNLSFNLSEELDWDFSERSHTKWPDCHYSKINYRPGNPYGDVRINWELNRLQFLPTMAVTDEDLARRIIDNWMAENPFACGPAYLSSMEVALRWFSIYWAVCLFKKPLPNSFIENLTGLAVASGKYISSRLSTHSSAGNHLIVEAVGLFWLGKALEGSKFGEQWINRARHILKEQIPKQINPDGSNQEQSFWYLGFVLDATLMYLLLEDRRKVPAEVNNRIVKMLEFVHEMTDSEGSFPDFGDRDDGYCFRMSGDYLESPFPGLLNVGSYFFDRPEWKQHTAQSIQHLGFWTGKGEPGNTSKPDENNRINAERTPEAKVFDDGGMTLMRWNEGRLLFRHAPLGLGNTCGHGHADALSIILYWKNVPVLIDLGSGQYNGNQSIRQFFRSTIAHNTVEIGGKDQARMLGPFMWEKSYNTWLNEVGKEPVLHADATHDGYEKDFSVLHNRRIEWPSTNIIEILDSFGGAEELPLRGAFHLGECSVLQQDEQTIRADFDDFSVALSFPPDYSLTKYYGSDTPFMGWKSTIYGAWEPIHTIIYSGKTQKITQNKITLTILEDKNNL